MSDINRKYFLKAGDKIHNFIIRQKVRDAVTTAPNMRRRWRVECCCGQKLTVPEYYLTRKSPPPKQHCGCLNKSLKTIHNNEFRIYIGMLARCNSPKHPSFEHYGGRGIKVCPEWSNPVDGFEQFFKHMGKRPSKAHSIDRINNDEGYYPGNVRWATAKEQRQNQRPRTQKATTSTQTKTQTA